MIHVNWIKYNLPLISTKKGFYSDVKGQFFQVIFHEVPLYV